MLNKWFWWSDSVANDSQKYDFDSVLVIVYKTSLALS